jgi:hypothetical protein
VGSPAALDLIERIFLRRPASRDCGGGARSIPTPAWLIGLMSSAMSVVKVRQVGEVEGDTRRGNRRARRNPVA